jgi:hypothetical protein
MEAAENAGKSQNLHQRWRLEKPVNRSKRIEMGAT